MTDAVPDDPAARRWAAAATLAAGGEDDGFAARFRTERQLVWVLAIVLGALVVALVVVLVYGAIRFRSDADTFPWGSALVFVAMGVLLIELIGRRYGPHRQEWARSPLSALDRTERRAAFRQINGRQPVEPEHVGALRGIAARSLERPWLGVLFPIALGTMAVSLIVSGKLDLLTVTAAIVALAAAAAIPFMSARQRRRSRAFLDEHPPAP